MSDYPQVAKNYNAVDVARFILSLVILCAHFANSGGRFPSLIDDAFSIYVIGVPFFYACSAYLFFQKIESFKPVQKSQTIKKYAKRLAIMYLAWSGVYFIFVLTGWFQDQAQISIILNYFHRALVFTTYATIWFLPALLIGVGMVYFLSRWLSFRTVVIVSVAFYLLGTLGYSYSFLLTDMPQTETIYQVYERLFITTRNGIFNGFSFIAIGAWMATRKTRIPPMISGVMTVFFLALIVIEAYTLRLKFNVHGVDTALSLLPFTFFFLEFLLALKIKDRTIYKHLRELSVLIFLSHRIYVSALPSVLPVAWVSVVFRTSWISLIVIILLTLVQSSICIKLSNDYRFFKILR